MKDNHMWKHISSNSQGEDEETAKRREDAMKAAFYAFNDNSLETSDPDTAVQLKQRHY